LFKIIKLKKSFHPTAQPALQARPHAAAVCYDCATPRRKRRMTPKRWAPRLWAGRGIRPCKRWPFAL